MVTVRSARLVAAAVCGIIRHLGRDQGDPAGGAPPRTCIAVDGGIFVRYGFYRELLKQGVRDILGDAVADQVHISFCAHAQDYVQGLLCDRFSLLIPPCDEVHTVPPSPAIQTQFNLQASFQLRRPM